MNGKLWLLILSYSTPTENSVFSPKSKLKALCTFFDSHDTEMTLGVFYNV